MTITIIEELKNDVIQQLKNKNLNTFKKFVLNYKIDLKEFEKYSKEDLLYLAIKNDNPKEVVNYIIKECQYKNVNYTINSNSSTPLGLAISRNNFEVADLLCDKYNADINYGKDMNRCFTYIYKNNSFQPRQLNYLLKRGYNFYDLSENIIKSMVLYYQNDLLEKIWNNTIYDDAFIIKLIQQGKKRQVFSSYNWNQMLKEEKQKVCLSDEIYETVFNSQNWEALRLFLNYEGREQKVTIFDMIEEYEVIEKAIDNKDIELIRAISNFGYALNYKCFNFEDLLMKSYSKNNDEIWKILIKSSILSYQEKEAKLITIFNNNLRNSDLIGNDIYLDYDYDSTEENDITNNIIIKNEDGFNYSVKNLSLDDNSKYDSVINTAYTNLITDSSFIKEPKQHVEDTKLAFPRLSNKNGMPSPPLAFDKINVNNNNNNNTIMPNPSTTSDNFNQNVALTSPPLEVHKGKRFNFYVMQEILKESQYNSSFLLNMAIRLHYEPMIKYLIEGDNDFKPQININAKDINGNYPLITFIRSDRCSHLNLLLYLLEKGANPNVKDSNGYSPLMLSIQKEFEMSENIPHSFVKILIKHGADVNEKDANGNTLLALSVQKNCIRMVDYLLQNGCPMNEKDASGNYPLMVAISQNQYEIVKLFMRYGKKFHQLKKFRILDINGNTPLTLAYKLNLSSIFKYLLKYLNINDTDAQGKSLLFHALERNDTKVVKYLIQVGAIVNQEDILGNTPLIYAIKRGSLFLVQKLVEHGANINVKDRSGTPSLIIAYDYQKMDIFKYLIEHNVTINEPFTENEINSIFFRIIIDKQIENLNYIIKYGANVNCLIGSLKSTPLMYACLFNDISMVKCLVENNANLNISNSQGNTALAYAISKHNLELVNYLIDHGADIYHKNNKEKSIFDVAYENCKHDLMQGHIINLNDKTRIYQKINYFYNE